jgi:hypothetical protein
MSRNAVKAFGELFRIEPSRLEPAVLDVLAAASSSEYFLFSYGQTTPVTVPVPG